MSSGKRQSKRKRKERNFVETEDTSPQQAKEKVARQAQSRGGSKESAKKDGTSFLEWMDKGETTSDGLVEHKSFAISVNGKRLDVRLGDTVILRGSKRDSSEQQISDDNRMALTGPRCMLARVEKIWETKDEDDTAHCRSFFLARWFLSPEDLEDFPADFVGPLHRDEFFGSLSRKYDVVLSNQCDENEVTTIAGNSLVIYRQPMEDRSLPTLPDNVYICRFSVDFENHDIEHGVLQINPFSGMSDNWNDFVTHDGNLTTRSSRPDALVKELLMSPRRRLAALENSVDGRIEQRDTQVGKDHQVEVPKFKKSKKIVSRRPVAVWKQGKASTTDIEAFLYEASSILVPYLQDNNLTHLEPYSPLGWIELEKLSIEMDNNLPTLSTICTASALSRNRTDMLREVDIEALMKLLHDSNYEHDQSLAIVKTSPGNFITTWKPHQKRQVNAAFRRYAGSFRMIYKALGGEKSFKDVIDYTFRFKIPDQYRIFQGIKQNQAIGMVERSEASRSLNANINISQAQVAKGAAVQNQPTCWKKCSVADVTGALAARRVKAKKILMDIQDQLGKDTLNKVMAIVQEFDDRPSDARVELCALLGGHPDLERRTWDFFPGKP